MVSHGRLRAYRKLPKATASWICDSRGFTELSQYGKWTIEPDSYVRAVRRYAGEIGQLVWASPQDWMCEPWIIEKTGLSVWEHQVRTVENLVLLRALAPDVPFIPVIQGWVLPDYLDCVALYSHAGVDLSREPVVGLGSVCRRQATGEVHEIVSTLAGQGLRLHGFGVKTAAVAAVGTMLVSADSMSWSYAMRRQKPGGCEHGLTKWARNCPGCAVEWRDKLLSKLAGVEQDGD